MKGTKREKQGTNTRQKQAFRQRRENWKQHCCDVQHLITMDCQNCRCLLISTNTGIIPRILRLQFSDQQFSRSALLPQPVLVALPESLGSLFPFHFSPSLAHYTMECGCGPFYRFSVLQSFFEKHRKGQQEGQSAKNQRRSARNYVDSTFTPSSNHGVPITQHLQKGIMCWGSTRTCGGRRTNLREMWDLLRPKTSQGGM